MEWSERLVVAIFEVWYACSFNLGWTGYRFSVKLWVQVRSLGKAEGVRRCDTLLF